MASDSKALKRQAAKFIAEAKADKQTHDSWHRDIYRYAMPWRRRPGSSTQQHDQDELFDSTAIEALSDFSADMQNTFTPIEENWLNVEPAQALSRPELQQIKGALEKYRDAVFSEIRTSNFSEAAQESYPDLGAGTCAMCIQDYNINEPIHCQAIPITDLLLVRGSFGGTDFRGRCLSLKARDLKPTYPYARLSDKILGKVANDPGGKVEVHECFWRLWDVPAVERWQFVLLIDNEHAFDEVRESAGCCSIIVARWRTDATTAWGVGPLYTTLPTIKTLDQLNYMILKQLNKIVDPPVVYDDDSVMNFDNGIVPGSAIPRATGSKVDVLEAAGEFDPGFFERSQMQGDIKRSLFQDKPDQQGKTPPTASQWLDEKAAVERRMGAPIGRLVTEWQLPIFQRFAYLLSKRGKLPPVELRGNVVRLRPQSPLVRAQRQQGVVISDRFLEILAARFGPESVQMMVDAFKTANEFKDRMGADAVVLRSEQEVAEMMKNAAQIAQQSGVVPGAEAA